MAYRRDINNSDMANSAVYTSNGDWIFIAQHNNKISLYDALNYNANTMIDIDTTGITPQGLAIKPDNQRLYVWNFMSRTIDTVDITAVGTSNAFPLKSSVSAQTSELLAANILAGKKIFYNATDPRMARDEYIACSTCHLEGGSDETVFDFTDGGEGLRNTITLLGRRGMGHGPVHWSANFDEIQDFEHPIRSLFGGTGFMSNANFNSGTRNTPLGDTKAGLSTELDNMAAYVASLSVVPMSPYRTANGTLTAAGEAGRVAFNAKNCASCHSGRDFTDSVSRARHDVGTQVAGSGNRLGGTLDGIDTPSLLGVWNTAPYLHNGSAATLAAVLTNEAHVGVLTAQEKTDIEAYLKQIDDVGRDVIASSLVVNDAPMASEWSFQPHLGSGDYAYGDRAHTWTTVPAVVADAAWLRPANDSKLYTGSPLATFTVNVSTDVYIANDDRWLTNAACPSGACPWLAGYADTTQDIILTEANGTSVRTYSVYKKTFAAGTVTLGTVNSNAYMMYVPIIKATPPVAVPAAPTGLAAIPGDRTVTLSWSASSGANTYTVQRSTTSGAGFADIVTGLGSTSFGDTGRTNGVTYYYRVAAVNGAGASGWSSEASATPTCSVLDAPTGLSASPGQAQATLSWNSVSGATGYNVKRGTTSSTTPPTVQSLATNVYTNTGLSAGTTYYFRVSATNSCGESANSTEVSVTPTSVSSKNAAFIVKDQDTGTAGIQLSAGDVSTQTHLTDLGFAVTVYDHAGLGTDGSDESSGKQLVFIASSVSSGNIANKFDTVAVPVVVAECLVWDDMRMSTVACTELNNLNTLHVENASSPLAAGLVGDPIITTAPAGLQGSPWLATADNVFSIPGDATKSALFAYESGVALASGTAPARRVAFFFSSLTGATETASVANATAWDIFGASANWATNTGASAPGAPTNLAVTGGFAQATLTWTGSAGATSYKVKRSVTSGSNYSVVGNATGTSYVDNGVANGQTYYYVVVASNAAGDSANSNQVSVTPNCTLAGVPTGLTATAGTGSVTVGWGAVSAANSYNVKRSTTSGSGYGTIASGVTTTQYVDTSVAVGTTYYYVVSSNNACGESANSAQASSGSSGSSTTSTVAPAADAHVRMGSSADTNYGTAAAMEVKNDDAANNTRQMYLRFSLSGIGSTVTSAKVRVYGNAVTAAKAMAIYAVSNFTWSETTTTWNNKPAIGAKQGSSVTISTTAGWWEFDVTSYVQARKTAGDGGVSFAFQNDAVSNNSPSSFQSKEGANDPQLVIIHQ
jgi:fibronectin type 3 domain-containing protein/mono/diheme cytochrome c family protein